MSTSRPRTDLLDQRMPVQLRLAAAWTSFMFLYLYVDYLHFYKPGSLEEVLGGRVHEFDTGPTFVATAVTLVSVPAVMAWLSATLPARANRLVNLVVAALYVPVTVYNMSGEENWDYAYFYGYSIGLELLVLAFVLHSAWTWPRGTAPTPAGLDAEPLRTPQQA